MRSETGTFRRRERRVLNKDGGPEEIWTHPPVWLVAVAQFFVFSFTA